MTRTSALRPLARLARVNARLERPSLRISTRACRSYATQSGATGSPNISRKQVTVVSDDGRVQWQDLSRREKAARTTQQTFNFGLVLFGVFMTGGVIYLLYTEVFSSDSKTRHFNRVVDRIRADERVLEILGSRQTLRAFGEPTANRWARARPIASTLRKDRYGAEHLLMHFNVEGSDQSGVVNVHMVKKSDQSEYEYKYLTLNVKSHPVLYLENADADKAKAKSKTGFSLFGVRWK